MDDARDRLKALPNELYNQVLTHLDLLSIKSLRLTSPLHAAKCLSPAFLAYYEAQETDLTPASLGRLREITRHPIFRPAVKRLTVVAVFHDPGGLLVRIRRLRDPSRRVWAGLGPAGLASLNMELLDHIGQLYRIMSSRHEQQGQFSDDIVGTLSYILEDLESLDVLALSARVLRPEFMNIQDVSGGRGVNWNCLWADCHRLLKIVTSAMSKSRVEVATFSVFNDCFGKVQVRRTFAYSFLSCFSRIGADRGCSLELSSISIQTS